MGVGSVGLDVVEVPGELDAAVGVRGVLVQAANNTMSAPIDRGITFIGSLLPILG